jgi:hypothetical protein
MRSYVLFDSFDPMEGWSGKGALPTLPGHVEAHADLAALHQHEELLTQQSDLTMQQSLMELTDLSALAHELTAASAMEAAAHASETATWNPMNYSIDHAGGGSSYHSEWGGSSFHCYVSPDGDVYINDYNAYTDVHTFTYTY